MPLSPSRQGYAFQHAIKDYFLELGFIAQEEHPATRTDICLSHSPLEIAVECKHVKGGVRLEHVQRFDERLKLWQRMGRPCLGVIVAIRFQEQAENLCEEKNILCITQQQIDDALARRRAGLSSEILFVSHRVANLLKSLSGLLDNWIPHLFRDPVDSDSLFLEPLLAQGYATLERELPQGKLQLDYSNKGEAFFAKCHNLFYLLQEAETRYSSSVQIAKSIATVLSDWREEEHQVYDKIVLMGLGVLEEYKGRFRKSAFADNLLRLMAVSGE